MQKLRLAMLGCGNIKHQHMVGIYEQAPGIEVAAACDINGETLAAFCERYGIARAYATPDELLSADGIDAISIAVIPEPEKSRLAIEALRRGLHVLAEKPMALTVKEARAMAAVARETGRVLQIGLNRRFEPVFRKAAETIGESARFGEVAGLRVVHGGPCEVPYVFFMAQLPHTFDLVQYLAGPVERIRSVTRRAVDPDRFAELQATLDRPGEREYNATEPGLVGISVASTLEFASGAVGTMDILGAGPGRQHLFEVYGTNKSAVTIHDMDRLTDECGGAARPFCANGAFRKASSFGLEYRHFADTVRGAAPTTLTLDDAVRSVCLYEAFILSLRTPDAVDVATAEVA